MSDAELDRRLVEAGMAPVEEMLQRNALGKFSVHAGVSDLASFEQWLAMRHAEFIRMQARMTLDGKAEEELFEWVISHNAAFGEVAANFRQAISSASANSSDNAIEVSGTKNAVAASVAFTYAPAGRVPTNLKTISRVVPKLPGDSTYDLMVKAKKDIYNNMGEDLENMNIVSWDHSVTDIKIPM
jgi:hypothetical protein